MNKPEQHSSFYTNEKLGFDLQLVEKGYQLFKPYFIGKTCLELGPATGYMTKHLVNDFDKVTVVEGSETLLQQIPDHHNLIKYRSLFEDFKTNEQFDTIILNHVLEHIEKPIELLMQIKEWLKPNGHLIIGVPNSRSFHRLAAVKMGLLNREDELNDRDIELGHYRVYNFDLLKEHVEKSGYNVIAEGGVFLKFLSNAQIEKNLEQNIIEAYFMLGNEFKDNSAEIFLVLSTF